MFGGGFQFSAVSFFTPPAPPPPGANNGLSVDPVTGNHVLGNDLGDVTEPAQLLSDRHIETDQFLIELQSTINASLMTIRPELLFMTGVSGQIQVGQVGSFILISHQDALTEPGGFVVFEASSNVGGTFTILNDEIVIHNQAVTELYRFLTGNIFIIGTIASNGARLQVNGDITTSDPGAGIGKWELGQRQAGVSVLDATQFIQVRIDGVLRKLALIV